MLFLNTKTKEYPRYQGDLELLGWTLGQELPTNWVQVVESEYPNDVPLDSKVIENLPVESNGLWVQKFTIVPMTIEEIALRDAPKTAREKLIALGLSEIEIRALASGLIR